MKKSNVKLLYVSLEDLRSDKRKLKRTISRKAKVVKTDAVDYVVSSNSVFFSSGFMHYVDYAVKAYKAYHILRKVSTFISKFRKKA